MKRKKVIKLQTCLLLNNCENGYFTMEGQSNGVCIQRKAQHDLYIDVLKQDTRLQVSDFQMVMEDRQVWRSITV